MKTQKKDITKVTLEDLKKEIKRLEPKLSENDDTFKTALILLSSIKFGPDTKAISRFAKIPLWFVGRRASNLRRSGIWKDGKIFHSGWFEKHGTLAFWLDVATAEGWIDRK